MNILDIMYNPALLFVFGGLCVIAAMDFLVRRIPNVLTYGVTIALCVQDPARILDAAIGFVIGTFIYQVGFFGTSLAEGDIKLSMLLSAAFGPIGVVIFLYAIFFSKWYRKVSGDRGPLPFAPFVLLSATLFIIGDKVLTAIVS